jgi:hypothetical protein
MKVRRESDHFERGLAETHRSKPDNDGIVVGIVLPLAGAFEYMRLFLVDYERRPWSG